jgi:dTDP-D-glucose 4,6-dehydratase
VADSTKLRSLGWTPEYSFHRGLEETIEWYVANHSVANLRSDLERRLTER